VQRRFIRRLLVRLVQHSPTLRAPPMSLSRWSPTSQQLAAATPTRSIARRKMRASGLCAPASSLVITNCTRSTSPCAFTLRFCKKREAVGDDAGCNAHTGKPIQHLMRSFGRAGGLDHRGEEGLDHRFCERGVAAYLFEAAAKDRDELGFASPLILGVCFSIAA
jgi:hypothetical protein